MAEKKTQTGSGSKSGSQTNREQSTKEQGTQRSGTKAPSKSSK